MERIGDLLLDRVAPAARRRATPLLFVHGMWGGSWYLENYLRFAAKAGWDAWAVNLRGHHGSRPVGDLGRVSVADYVTDVADVLDRIGPAAVVGHSMGGLIAQLVAHRSDVRAAVFMTSAAPRGIVVLRWPVLSRMWRYLGAMIAARPFRTRDDDSRALLLNRLEASVQATLLPRFVEESGRAARELAFGLIPVDATRVRCPTLVVGASRDRITPPAVQRRIARKYGADYLEAEGHAHMLSLEDGWEEPLARVLGWLESRVA
ncbi:MAG: alpha/beta fold hydrolase [Candidatus Rokubacteria bacterium]|nr:alpha/beta fold hydrolase [Candidatus Rokubacteria bacterium]